MRALLMVGLGWGGGEGLLQEGPSVEKLPGSA